MLVLLAFAWFSTGVEDRADEASDWSRAVAAADARREVNEGRTSGAPQQQVVNGWYTNDLAGIHAEQLGAQYDQIRLVAGIAERTAALLGVIALTFIGDLLIRALPRRVSGMEPSSTSVNRPTFNLTSRSGRE